VTPIRGPARLPRRRRHRDRRPAVAGRSHHRHPPSRRSRERFSLGHCADKCPAQNRRAQRQGLELAPPTGAGALDLVATLKTGYRGVRPPSWQTGMRLSGLGRFRQDRRSARLGPGVRRDALHAAGHRDCSGVALLRFCVPSFAVSRRGSRGNCLARNSNARLAIQPVHMGGVRAVGKVFIGVDPHKLSATIVIVDGHETASPSSPRHRTTPMLSAPRRGPRHCSRNESTGSS
jgi:hypothetical protein